jgi:tetratricopeptide (TPR) repeat protein
MVGSEPFIYPPHYPHDGTYADLLCWHMDYWGTRPKGSTTVNGLPWGRVEFRQEAFGKVWENDTTRIGLESWRGAGSAPAKSTALRISDALFGKSPIFQTWRKDLEDAHKRSQGPGNNPRTKEFPNPPPPPPDTLASSIPRLTPYFAGRDDAVMATVNALVAPEGLPTILVQGGPGIGKTEMTKAIARHADIVARFGERRWFVRLENAHTADKMKDVITRALGCDPQYGFQAALGSLHGKLSLLVLDNLETPWEPIAEREAIEEALADLAAVQGVALLASMRGHEWMKIPKWQLQALPVLLPEDAYSLFAAIAGSWVLTDPILSDFMAALGGLPLAIELVARRAHGRASLTPLWEEWARIGAELARHPDFAEGRQTSLPHSIEMSLRSSRMTAPAMRLFSLLGCSPSGLSREDLAPLMVNDAYAAEERLLTLGLAVENSGRVALLPPIREHAARRYPPDNEDAARWVDHFWNMIIRLGKTIGTAVGATALERLEAEFDNIEACLKEMLLRNRRRDAVFALPGLVRLIITKSLDSNVIQQIEICCNAEAEFLDRAHCLTMLGDIARARSRYDVAESYYALACPLYESLQYSLGEANCRQGIAKIALMRGDYSAARSEYESLITIYQRLGEKLGEANCMRALADIALEQSELESSRAIYDSARLIYVGIEHTLGEAHCVSGVGNIEFDLKNFSIAIARYNEAFMLYGKAGSMQGEANCIKSIGHIELIFGNLSQSRASYIEAIDRYKEIDDALGQANCMVGLGDIANMEGKFADARDYYQDGLLRYRSIENERGENTCIKRMEGI